MGSPLSLWMAFRLLRTHWVLYCATCRGVGALFRVQGCEEGSKSALVGLGHAETLSPPGEPPSTFTMSHIGTLPTSGAPGDFPLNFHVCPTSGRRPQVGHRAI
jgi:hypothetical protein